MKLIQQEQSISGDCAEEECQIHENHGQIHKLVFDVLLQAGLLGILAVHGSSWLADHRACSMQRSLQTRGRLGNWQNWQCPGLLVAGSVGRQRSASLPVV